MFLLLTLLVFWELDYLKGSSLLNDFVSIFKGEVREINPETPEIPPGPLKWGL